MTNYQLTIILIVLTYLLYKIYKWYNKNITYYVTINNLPGPPFYEALTYIAKLRYITPVEMFNYVVDAIKYGPLYRAWILFHPQLVVQSCKELEPIVKDMAHINKSQNYRMLHPWMGEGLLTATDEKWRVHRKVLTPAFHFNILHEFLPIFNKNAIKLNKRLRTEINNKNGFDAFKHISLCSLDIICESSMGIEINAQEDEYSPYVTAVNKLNDLLVKRYFVPWLRPDFIWNLTSLKREMDETLIYLNNFTDKVINNRRELLNSKDFEVKSEKKKNLAFLDLLLEAEKQGSEFMTQKDLRDQVSTFMFEGHDTIATSTSWALFLIGTYPEVQDKIVRELEEVFGDSGRVPTMNDLVNLKYLERSLKESLRLYPSVAFFERYIKEEVQIGKYKVPAGCNITLNAYLVHRDPEYWPDPEKFDPDRFLPENSQGRHPYAYVPFSAGPRNCIGQKYALLEEKVLVSTILREYIVKAAHTRESTLLQIAVTLKPKNGLTLNLFDRVDKPKLRVQ